MENPESLLARVYKGRYYNSSTFLQQVQLVLHTDGNPSKKVKTF